jgi:glyoxylate reductase
VQPKVLITNCVPADHLQPLEGLAHIIQGPGGGDLMPRSEVLELAPELRAIINQSELKVDLELLERAPQLEVVANVALGFDNLDPTLMASKGVWATNCPYDFTEATADCTLALLLALWRFIPKADRYVRNREWQSFQPGLWDGLLLRGKVIGMVGYGSIGKAVAERAQAFGMEVIFYQRTPVRDPRYRSLEQLLAEADVVSLHTPLNDDSYHLMNTARLAMMKPGSFLVNMARGKVVDEKALVAALERGHLAGAALDVFEEEPMVQPALLGMDNVVLAPHIGGGTREGRKGARLHCARNVAAVLRGERPLTPVNEL